MKWCTVNWCSVDCQPALITADVFEGPLKGQFNIPKGEKRISTKVAKKGNKVKMASSERGWGSISWLLGPVRGQTPSSASTPRRADSPLQEKPSSKLHQFLRSTLTPHSGVKMLTFCSFQSLFRQLCLAPLKKALFENASTP